MSHFDRIVPVLTYRDIGAAHDFLVKAFGFHGAGVDRNADGQAVHGEVRAGDAPNRSISHTGSASMARGILKGTDGGLRLRWRPID